MSKVRDGIFLGGIGSDIFGEHDSYRKLARDVYSLGNIWLCNGCYLVHHN